MRSIDLIPEYGRLVLNIIKCHLKRIEKLETYEELDCIRQANEGFKKSTAYLMGWNVSSEGK